MTRRFGWVLNLDAELELARGRPGYVPQQKLLLQLAEHGRSSRQLLGPNDVLLEPAERGGELRALPTGLIGRAWCPTPLALASLQRHGASPEPHPPAEVLRRVNHRLFAHELRGGLPEQAYVQTREQLLLRLAGYARHWLLKRPLGFAGRGQLRVIGSLTEKQMTWVDASLKRDGLLVEPLVTPTFEVSLHGFIWPGGRRELGRICTQIVSERGAFRDVRLVLPGELLPSESGALHERAHAAADALFSAAYFGPFGIDGYRYTLDGASAFCALGEINARYTLGFTTGFPRHPSELSLDD
jgi:hypothetical protein